MKILLTDKQKQRLVIEAKQGFKPFIVVETAFELDPENLSELIGALLHIQTKIRKDLSSIAREMDDEKYKMPAWENRKPFTGKKKEK